MEKPNIKVISTYPVPEKPTKVIAILENGEAWEYDIYCNLWQQRDKIER